MDLLKTSEVYSCVVLLKKPMAKWLVQTLTDLYNDQDHSLILWMVYYGVPKEKARMTELITGFHSTMHYGMVGITEHWNRVTKKEELHENL